GRLHRFRALTHTVALIPDQHEAINIYAEFPDLLPAAYLCGTDPDWLREQATKPIEEAKYVVYHKCVVCVCVCVCVLTRIEQRPAGATTEPPRRGAETGGPAPQRTSIPIGQEARSQLPPIQHHLRPQHRILPLLLLEWGPS